jgi:hypothetical protein
MPYAKAAADIHSVIQARHWKLSDHAIDAFLILAAAPTHGAPK